MITINKSILRHTKKRPPESLPKVVYHGFIQARKVGHTSSTTSTKLLTVL
ncbi:hypothetical protein M2298_000325 [Brevibacillus sp. 1238]|nr:hypothetical protein [Brevibacillus sp. 1238]